MFLIEHCFLLCLLAKEIMVNEKHLPSYIIHLTPPLLRYLLDDIKQLIHLGVGLVHIGFVLTQLFHIA